MKFLVKKKDDNKRLDVFLSEKINHLTRSNIKKIPSELSDLITLITAAIGSCMRATFPIPAIEAAFNVAVFCI